MRIFKPTYRGADGGTHEARVYWVDAVVDGHRIRRSLKTRDSKTAMKLALDLVRKEEQRAAGIITPLDDHAAVAIGKHVEEFMAELAGRRITTAHHTDRERTLKMFIDEARVKRLTDLDGPRAARWLKSKSDAGLSARSVNRLRAGLLQFSRWLHVNGRLATDPFATIKSLNEAADRRHERRALTPEELRRLVEAAAVRPLAEETARRVRTPVSPDRRRDLEEQGAVRALIYEFAAGTGVRRGEILRLRWRDLDLDRGEVHVPAAAAKARKDQSVPLRADLVEALRRHRGRTPAATPLDRVFPSSVFPTQRTYVADLEAAKIPRRDESGRAVDFHSLRVTFVTGLARSGVHPRVAQALARHSDISLTMQAYTDVSLFDLRSAVEGLPPASGPAPAAATATAAPESPARGAVLPGGARRATPRAKRGARGGAAAGERA